MSSKKKPVRLADKITDLLTAAPKIIDSDDDFEETKAKVVDFDEEIDEQDNFQTESKGTNIRRRNVGLLEESDKRYAGKKVSKKEIFGDGLDSDGSNDVDFEDGDSSKADGTDEEDEVSEENGSIPSGNEDEGSEEEESDEEDGDDKGSDEEDEDDESDMDDMDDMDTSIDLSNPLRRERQTTGGIKTVSATNVRAEIEKGNDVRRQLKMWEDLVEMRIRFQKCLVAGNIMPQQDVYKDYVQNPKFKKDCNDVKNKLSNLLGNLLDLQSSLLGNFSETKHLSSGKKRKLEDDDEPNDPMDEEIPSDTDDETDKNGKDASGDENKEDDEEEDEEGDSDGEEVKEPSKKKLKLKEYEKIIAKNHSAYSEYRDTVIRKWNDKTRLASGVISKGSTQPITRQIEFLLSNKDKLLKKTQLKRMNYEIIGKDSASLDENDGRHVNEYDTEIYDDNDFYQQILKEMIECKTAGVDDPVKLGQEWAKLQDMRKKMKRKIDTRATKGRRIRYDVHQKLVNFMGPITVFDTWTDHSKNELYSSLFGKIKSVSQVKKDSNPT